MAQRKWGYSPPGAERSCRGPPALLWSVWGLPERVAEPGQPQPNTTPLTGTKIPGVLGGLTQVVSPPPLLLPLPAVSCLPSISPLFRGPISELETGPLRDPGVQRLYHWPVSMWPPRSMRFSLCPVHGASGQSSVGPQRFRTTSTGQSVVGGRAACDPRGIWCVPSGGICGVIPEPCSGLIHA